MSLGKKRSGFQITSVTTDYQPFSPISPPPVDRSRSPTPTNGPCSPPTSRFRLVRLDQSPLGGGRRYQKGRWSCVEFYHPEVGSPLRAGAGHSLDSGLPRPAPVLSPLLLSPGSGSKLPPTPRSEGAPVLAPETKAETKIELSPPPALPARSPSPVPTPHDTRPSRPVSDVFNERLILARSVFCMEDEKDNDSGSSTSLVAIDNKIEQAM
ncbi:TSC22 domain family protein 4-like, partial [Rhinophrynus dorsalis]